LSKFQATAVQKSAASRPKSVFKGDMTSIEELEAKLDQARSTGPDYSLQRRLIQRLCADSNNYSKTRLDKIEQLTAQLPQLEFTPLLCQDLMYFYTKVGFNP
jgi:hypothetical protein